MNGAVKPSLVLVRLAAVLAVLGLAAALSGLLWPGSGSAYIFTSLRGVEVQMYGRGLYRYDTLMSAATFIGTDWVTLFIALPVLVLYARGSLRGLLLMGGGLAYLLYYGASLALSAAYNNLFLLYVAIFSLGLYTLLLMLRAVDLRGLAERVSSRVPHRAISRFLFVAGGVVGAVWLMDVVTALAQNSAPAIMGTYTTLVTHALDLGVIVPAAVITAVLVSRRAPLGYPLAAALLVLNALIGFVVAGQTIVQTQVGIVLPLAAILAYVASFIALSLAALWLTYRLLMGISDAPAAKPRSKGK